MSDLKTLAEILLNDLSTIAEETGCCPICDGETEQGHTAAKVVITRDNAKFGGRVRIQMFAADGSEMYGEFIAVGPRGGISA